MTLQTANGSITTDEVVNMKVSDLNEVIQAYVVEDSPTLISLGKLCTESGYDFIWKAGQVPFLRKDGKKKVPCVPDMNVPIVSANIHTAGEPEEHRSRKRRNG